MSQDKDRELIERLALEAAKEYLKFKLGSRKGFDIYDLDEETDELEKEIEQECADAFSRFLSAYLAERGKESVCVVENDGCEESIIDKSLPVGTKLFLTQQIPEGYALVPIEPTQKMFDAGEETFVSGYTGTPTSSPSAVWNAMLTAAGEKP